MNGIDIYEGDNIQDWNAVKAADFEVVIQKASQGISHKDSLLEYRYPRIKEAGLKIGFYHFAGTHDPQEEAEFFLSTISDKESDTVLFLDIEDTDTPSFKHVWSKQEAINFANTFIQYVRNQGFQIGIYTGNCFYHDYLEGNIPDVPLWIASYGKQPDLYPSSASWQYSESGSIPGTVGNVDLDYFTDNIFIRTEEEFIVENLVVVPFIHTFDREIAWSLAESLKCPILDANILYDYSKIKHVYCIGCADKVPFTSYATKVFTGADRWETANMVKDFINNGCK